MSRTDIGNFTIPKIGCNVIKNKTRAEEKMKSKQKIKSRPSLKQIAQLAGVSIPTVSDVLRNRKGGKVKVSENTKQRILAIAKEFQYEPQFAGRALVTGKTYTIGFLVSAKTTLGLANHYFSTLMAGIQEACKVRNYTCIVSAYDLSSVENLIVPVKLRRKIVDGVIITGYIEKETINILQKYEIPFLIIGECKEFSDNLVLTVTRDIIEEWVITFEYLYKTGIKHIGIANINVKRITELEQSAKDKFKKMHPDVQFTSYRIPYEVDQFEHGKQIAKEWYKLPANDKPTGIVSHDQWVVGFIYQLVRYNVAIPQEVSLVSTCDTVLCQYNNPSISALYIDLFDRGRKSAEVFIDYLEGKISYDESTRIFEALQQPGKLVIRESTLNIQ